MQKLKFRAWSTSTEKMYFLDPNNKTAKDNTLFDLKEHATWKVMQFIGLEDKNGKETYHKDRIEFWTVDSESGHADKWIGTIEWDKEDLCWYVLNDSDKWSCVKFRFIDYFKIIGNIYENPDKFLIV